MTHRSMVAVAAAFCLLGISSGALAFEHISTESGFKADIPEENFVFVAQDRVIGGQLDGLNHGVLAPAKYLARDFSTKKFEGDLKLIAAELKAGRDIAKDERFAYIFKNYDEEMLLFNSDKKSLYEVASFNKVPALKILTSSKMKATVPLPVALNKDEQAKAREEMADAVFSADGKSMTINVRTETESYVLSQNNKLYIVFSNYTDKPQEIKKGTKVSEEQIAEKRKALTKLFAKNSKRFNQSLSFFPARSMKSSLLIRDRVTGTDFAVPSDWVYLTGTDKNKKDTMDVNIFAAFPFGMMDKLKEELIKEGGKSGGEFDIKNLNFMEYCGMFREGMAGVSIKDRSKSKGKPFILELLEKPEETRKMVNMGFEKWQEVIGKDTLQEIEKYCRISNLTHEMNINTDRGLLDFGFDTLLHLPKDISKAFEKGTKLTDADLFPMELSMRNKVYIDKGNRAGFVVYGRRKGIPGNSPAGELFNKVNFLPAKK